MTKTDRFHSEKKLMLTETLFMAMLKLQKYNWDGGVQLKKRWTPQSFLPLIKSDEAFKMPPVTVMDTKKAYTFVLDNVGANFPNVTQ